MNQHARHDTRGLIFPTEADLKDRAGRLVSAGYPVSKWITFMQSMLELDLTVGVYEANKTRSKYVHVFMPGGDIFKVRFSNHPPTVGRQESEDSDFYVGVSNGLTTTTADAVEAAISRLRGAGPNRGSIPHPAPLTRPSEAHEAARRLWTDPVKQRGTPDAARVSVRVECRCGNSFNALVKAKRRCKVCGAQLRAKDPNKQGEDRL